MHAGETEESYSFVRYEFTRLTAARRKKPIHARDTVRDIALYKLFDARPRLRHDYITQRRHVPRDRPTRRIVLRPRNDDDDVVTR